jgi:hypothetical protein
VIILASSISKGKQILPNLSVITRLSHVCFCSAMSSLASRPSQSQTASRMSTGVIMFGKLYVLLLFSMLPMPTTSPRWHCGLVKQRTRPNLCSMMASYLQWTLESYNTQKYGQLKPELWSLNAPKVVQIK